MVVSKGFHKAYIALSYDAAHLHPWGSHPLLDTYYSSAHFQIEHHGLEMSSFEKTALVADWPIALKNVRVCQKNSCSRGQDQMTGFLLEKPAELLLTMRTRYDGPHHPIIKLRGDASWRCVSVRYGLWPISPWC